MAEYDRTRRSVLRYCSLGLVALGGCVSGDQNPGNSPTPTETTGTQETDERATKTAKTSKSADSADAHPVLLAVSSYANSDHEVAVTVRKAKSTLLNETVTVPVNGTVTFEDTLVVPKSGSVKYEIMVAVQDGATATKKFTIKSSHDVHAISAVVMSANSVRWGTNGH